MGLTMKVVNRSFWKRYPRLAPARPPSPTSAAPAVLLQEVPPGTGAQVAALSVLTQEVAGLWRLRALIHVCKSDRGAGIRPSAPGYRSVMEPARVPAHSTMDQERSITRYMTAVSRGHYTLS